MTSKRILFQLRPTTTVKAALMQSPTAATNEETRKLPVKSKPYPATIGPAICPRPKAAVRRTGSGRIGEGVRKP